MMQIARDPAWQLAGVLLALVTIVATLVIYRLQQPRRALMYRITHAHLLSVNEHLEGVSLVCRGEERRSLWMVAVDFENVGNTPVLKADFERPISIILGEDARSLISAKVTWPVPPELSIGVSASGGAVTLEPTLLNPGDRFRVQMLTSEIDPQKTRLDYRIAGVNQMSHREPMDRWRFHRRSAALHFGMATMMTLTGLMMLAVFTYASRAWFSPLDGFLINVPVLLGVYVSFWVVVRRVGLVRFTWPWRTASEKPVASK